jgi:hypothetical protein
MALMTTKKFSSEPLKEANNKIAKTEKPGQRPENSPGCCMSTPTSQTSTETYNKPSSLQISPYSEESRKGPKTRITIKYDVGFNNSLYLRGKGANLSWDKGTPLKNVKFDEWIWETQLPFTNLEFKVLINDRQYENGPNHMLASGADIHYTPYF